MFLTPNDSPLKDNTSSMKNKNFGANRQQGSSNRYSDNDYTKTSANYLTSDFDNTKVIDDIDDLNNDQIRKREASRRAETADRRDHNKERFPESDSSNRPYEYKSPVSVPDGKKHGSKAPYHFGEGQYEGEIS
jgi:hypothetical protein